MEQVGKENYSYKEQHYHNQSLRTLVKSLNSEKKIKIIEGKFEQIIDPIYRTPERTNYSIKAHFLASIKPIPSTQYYLPTFWMNTIVIWLMSILGIIAVYYEWLKHFIIKVTKVNWGNLICLFKGFFKWIFNTTKNSLYFLYKYLVIGFYKYVILGFYKYVIKAVFINSLLWFFGGVGKFVIGFGNIFKAKNKIVKPTDKKSIPSAVPNQGIKEVGLKDNKVNEEKGNTLGNIPNEENKSV